MIRNYVPRFLLLLILLFVMTDCSLVSKQHRRTSRILLDREHVRIISSAIIQIHKATGRRFGSLEEYTGSYYYPFEDDLRHTLTNGILYMKIATAGKELHISYTLVYEGKEMLSAREVIGYRASVSSISETKSLLNTYTMPVSKRLSQVKEDGWRWILGNYDETTRYYAIKYQVVKPSLDRKMLVKPSINDDLPATENELKLFVEWQSLLEGVDSLDDAWGNRVEFRLTRHSIKATSRGADGVVGTNDDIMLERRLSDGKVIY